MMQMLSVLKKILHQCSEMLGFFLIQNKPGEELKLQTSHAKLAPGSTSIGTFKSCIGSYCRAVAQCLVSSIANKGTVK